MAPFLFASLVALTVQTAPVRASGPALTSYEEIIRCAGLTQAASEMEGGESAAGRALFDGALYWALTASQAAQAGGKTPTAADADQTRARITAVQQLGAASAPARAALQRCQERTPDLG